MSEATTLTPRQLVSELDRYIIGQNAAKKAVSIALRNRWRRQQVDISLRDEIRAANPPKLGQLAPETPPAVVAVCERALAADPATRFQNGGALAGLCAPDSLYKHGPAYHVPSRPDEAG